MIAQGSGEFEDGMGGKRAMGGGGGELLAAAGWFAEGEIDERGSPAVVAAAARNLRRV